MGRSKYKIHTCEICNKTFDRKDSLTSHEAVHSENKQFSCDMCEKSFKHRVDLKRHEMVHTCVIPFACDICGRGFARKDKLKSHILSIHTQNDSPSSSQQLVEALKCDICFETFPSNSQLERHQNFHKGQSFYQGEKKFSCDACDKMFVSKRTLETHKRIIHLGLSSHKCSICNKPFAKVYDLKMHQVVHTGERPHSCDVCNKTFSVKSSLKEHMRLHSGERPFKCDKCDKSYTRKRDLVYHEKSHKIKVNNSQIAKEDSTSWKTERIELEPSIVKQEIIENFEETEQIKYELYNSSGHNYVEQNIKLEHPHSEHAIDKPFLKLEDPEHDMLDELEQNCVQNINVQHEIKLEDPEQIHNEQIGTEHPIEHIKVEHSHSKHNRIDEQIGVEQPIEHINVEPSNENEIKLEAEEMEESLNYNNFEDEESEDMNGFADNLFPKILLGPIV